MKTEREPRAGQGRALPPFDEMYTALVERDSTYEGIFFVGVRTTGITCRPTCRAKKPNRENVEFFANLEEAMLAGYRPCKRCRPLEPLDEPPEWLRPLLEEVEATACRARWRDADLRERGFDPVHVRRWFVDRHGMTFHAFLRARRVGEVFGRMQHDEELRQEVSLLQAGHDAGYESASGFRDAFTHMFGMPPGEGRRVAKHVFIHRIGTPLGSMVAIATERSKVDGTVTDGALWLVEFADRRMLETQIARVHKRLGKAAFVPGTCSLIERLRVQLGEYFEGERRSFDLPLRLDGTDFQKAVWDELLRIPAGEVRSYAELAAAIGRPTAVRAVGRANGDNRFAILVPCHRVVGANGDLVGYGGKLWRKKWLLDRERE